MPQMFQLELLLSTPVQVFSGAELELDVVVFGAGGVEFAVAAEFGQAAQRDAALGAGELEDERLRPLGEDGGPRFAAAFGEQVDKLLVVPEELPAGGGLREEFT